MKTDKGLLGRDEALSILEGGLRGSPADQTELVLLADSTDVTRYANSEIHQNVSQANTRVSVRVASLRSVRHATARVYTNSLDVQELRRTIEEATRLARMQSPNPQFQSLPTPEMGRERAAYIPQCELDCT